MKTLLAKVKSQSLSEFIKEYKWLGRYSLHYKGAVFWYILVQLLGIAVSLAGSLLSKFIIDAVTGFNSRGIFTALVFFVLMQLSQIAISAISGRITAKVSIRVNQQITAEVYDSLLQTDWQALSAYHSGDLLTRVVGDVSTVSSSILGWLPELLTRLVQFVGILCVIVYFDTTLALLALLSAPVTLLMGRYAVSKMYRHSRQMRQLNSEMTVFNEESFQNIQLIKSFHQTEAYSQRHRDLQKRYKDASMDYNRFTIHKNTVLSLVGTVVALVCFIWSIYRLKTGHITFGTMTLFLQLSGVLSGAFSALAGLIPGAINAATAAGRIMAIVQLPEEDRGGETAADAFMQKHADALLSIRAQDLCCHYDDGREILSHCDFQANGGEIVTFVGPSGEGKTTLLRLLLGLIRPQKGTLEICAPDGETIPVSAATRKLFGYVPQGNILFSGTIGENLRLINPQATDRQIYEALALACAEDFVRQLPLGLDTPVQEQGGLSEGQLQRLCIARALLSDAPILLLDEATSALDMQTEHQVLENILRCQKNRTLIVTTHRPSVLKISHRIYQIHHDRITLCPQ